MNNFKSMMLLLKKKVILKIGKTILIAQGGFAWLIPFPYIPGNPDKPPANVDEISGSNGFDFLVQMTSPKLTIVKHFVRAKIVHSTDFGCSCSAPLEGEGPMSLEGDSSQEVNWGIQIWGESQTENFSFVQISGSSAQEISFWMEANGYGKIGSTELPLFQNYCDTGFSFLIITAREYQESQLHSNEIPGEKFNQELEWILSQGDLSLANLNSTSQFRQDCSINLPIQPDDPIMDPSQFPFLFELNIPDVLWIGRFRRAYSISDEMLDIYFQPMSQEDFQGEIRVHVKVKSESREVS